MRNETGKRVRKARVVPWYSWRDSICLSVPNLSKSRRRYLTHIRTSFLSNFLSSHPHTVMINEQISAVSHEVPASTPPPVYTITADLANDLEARQARYDQLFNRVSIWLCSIFATLSFAYAFINISMAAFLNEPRTAFQRSIVHYGLIFGLIQMVTTAVYCAKWALNHKEKKDRKVWLSFLFDITSLLFMLAFQLGVAHKNA